MKDHIETDDMVIRVPAERLASGKWCHKTDRMIGEGDIDGSYSADKIGMGEPNPQAIPLAERLMGLHIYQQLGAGKNP